MPAPHSAERIRVNVRLIQVMNHSFPVVNWFLSLIYLLLGDHARARAASLTALRESNDGAMYLATLGCVLARAGERDAAHDVVRILERRSSEQYISPLDMCIAHAGFEDLHASLLWLEKAVGQRVMRVTELGMPLFEAFRHEPKFTACVQRVGLPGRPAASSTSG